MGSQFKSAVLEEQTADAIKQWHAEMRKKRMKQHRHGNGSAATTNDNQDSSTSSRYRGHYRGSSLSPRITKADKTDIDTDDETDSSTSYHHHRNPTFSEQSRIYNHGDHIDAHRHEIVEPPREADHIVQIVELRETNSG
ncbi:hypothetical protein SAY87_012929 [Trapa incisa]|uniref:Uncharacterized protein n=1 Tax=Trapa incisa TaxID=236973 RepID=A0AAN7KG77_9MYRT|nr:hypothetical protein SAY87_012929 [Trapa incisa]